MAMTDADSLNVPVDDMIREVKSCVDAGAEAVLTVRGTSMMPFLRDGRDMVRLGRRDVYCEMDVVLAHLPDADRWVLHRLMWTDGVHAVLMGDGNCRMRERVRVSDIVAAVVAVKRGDGDFTANGVCRRMAARVWRVLLPLRPVLLKLFR